MVYFLIFISPIWITSITMHQYITRLISCKLFAIHFTTSSDRLYYSTKFLVQQVIPKYFSNEKIIGKLARVIPLTPFCKIKKHTKTVCIFFLFCRTIPMLQYRYCRGYSRPYENTLYFLPQSYRTTLLILYQQCSAVLLNLFQ